MFKAIIIDDEEDARKVLLALLKRYCPNVTVVGIAESLKKGEVHIRDYKPDIVFLDVELHRGSGFDIIDKFGKNAFSIIFVTAHDKYALKALKNSAVDYLLKPIIVSELIEAVQKVKAKESLPIENNQPSPNNKDKLNKIALPSKGGTVFKNFSEIICCKADSNYTVFYFMEGEPIMVGKNLKEFENILVSPFFCRIHDSHIVNIELIEKYLPGKNMVVMKTGDELLISRRRKRAFLDLYYR